MGETDVRVSEGSCRGGLGPGPVSRVDPSVLGVLAIGIKGGRVADKTWVMSPLLAYQWM